MERRFVCVTGCALGAVVALAAGCGGAPASPPVVVAPPKQPVVAGTESRAMPVGLDEAAMDPAVAPCDDFYRYACGRWIDHAEIRKDYPLVDRSFVALTFSTRDQLRAILDEAAADRKPSGAVTRLLGQFYGACIDDADGGAVAMLRGELGQLRTMRGAAQLAARLGALHRRGGQALFGYGIAVDPDTATNYIAEIDDGGLGLPTRDYYLDDDDKTRDIRAHYRAYIAAVSRLLGDPEAAAGQRADAVIAVETQLAKAALTPVQRRDSGQLKHRFDLAGLRRRAPRVAWQAFFDAAGTRGVATLNVVNPAMLDAIDELGKTMAWPALQAYVGWHMVLADRAALPRAFRDARHELERVLSGVEQVQERPQECSELTEAKLRELVGQAYIARHFQPVAKQRVAAMAQAIAAEFRANLGRVTWMDEATRARALEKLDAFVIRIGYPDAWRSFDDLALDRASFVTSWRRATEHETRYEDGKLGKPVDRRFWDWGATTINMGNSLELNAVTFPAAILQSPIFDVAAPIGVVYGSAGVFIGHEFTHGFDDQGRQFDARGGTTAWWSEPSSREFTARAACLKDQFDRELWIDDIHVDGALTLGENIADLGGLVLAYAAMQAAHRGVDEPVARFTPEQQFFLGYAQDWCSKYRPELSRLLARSDPHSPPALRVNLPLRNLPQFQAAFSCPATARMVRPAAERCGVW